MKRWFLTVDRCGEGRRGVFCNTRGTAYSSEIQHTSSDCAREDQPICAAGCGTVVEADGDYCSKVCYDKEQYYRRGDYDRDRQFDC